MVIANTPTIQDLESGTKVVSIKVLTATAYYGVGLWTSLCCLCASIFGCRSKNYEKKVEKAKNDVVNQLLSKAKLCNADGIINLQFQMHGLSIIAYGTAVKIEK